MQSELQLLTKSVRENLTELGIDVLADKLQDLDRERDAMLLRRRKVRWQKTMQKRWESMELLTWRFSERITRQEMLQMSLEAIQRDATWSMSMYLTRFEKEPK